MACLGGYTCDACGKQKRGGGWWLASITPFDFQLRPWEDDCALAADAHLCGQACVVQRLSEWMAPPESVRFLIADTFNGAAHTSSSRPSYRPVP